MNLIHFDTVTKSLPLMVVSQVFAPVSGAEQICWMIYSSQQISEADFYICGEFWTC